MDRWTMTKSAHELDCIRVSGRVVEDLRREQACSRRRRRTR